MGHPRRRGRALLVAGFVLLTVLVAQVFRIQGIDAAKVSAQALDSRLHKVTIPAMRGSIIDSQGTVLASSVERRNLTADPTIVVDYAMTSDGKGGQLCPNGKQCGLDGAAAAMAPIIGVDKDSVLATLTAAAAKHRRFVYLAKDLSPDQWRQIAALQIPGIYSEKVVKRIYPQGTAIAPLLGWVGANGEPGGGVEQMEQKVLNGTPGLHVFEQAPDGTMIATGDNTDTPAKPGSDVALTIDNNIQWYAANLMAATVKKWGAMSAEAVVMDAKTGELRAVAQYPSFDNNTLAMASPESLQSTAFTRAYEPGSTNKAITISAGLDQGVITPQTQEVVPPLLPRAGQKFHDAEPHGTEYLTTAGIIGKSSNIGTILLDERMSNPTLYNYMVKYGFGSPTGIGYPGESQGIVAKPDQWGAAQRFTIMFGQGVAATAVQQASVFQTIANGGVREPVKLVRGINAGNGWQAPTDSRKPLRVTSPKAAAQMASMMEGVVSKDGTAPKAAVPGYKVAGKTGTADFWDPTVRRYHGVTASFIGFAPADNPRYVVQIAVNRPTNGKWGGDIAAPAFSELMQYVLQYEKVPPTGPQPIKFNFTFNPSEARRP